MTWQRYEGRVTMYLAMAIWLHITRDIWEGLFGIAVIVIAMALAWLPEKIKALANEEKQ